MEPPHPQCLIHCKNDDTCGELKQLSDVRWETVLKVCEEWCGTGTEEEVIALRLLTHSSKPASSYFHDKCFNRFVNKRRLVQAKNKVKEGEESNSASSHREHRQQIAASYSGCDRRTSGILPPQCIVCKKLKWKTSKSTCLRTKEKLTQVRKFVLFYKTSKLGDSWQAKLVFIYFRAVFSVGNFILFSMIIRICTMLLNVSFFV